MRPAVAILAGLCLLLGGCAGLKVKKPASDSTPPSLVWNVFNHDTRDQADHAGSVTLAAKRGASFRIILKANDLQGVQSIQLNPGLGSGEMAWTCHDPPGGEPLAQNKTATFAPKTQNLAPDANGMVLTSIFLIQELGLEMECPQGWSFSGGSVQLTGRASNYFGGVTNAMLKFNVTP